MSSKAKSVSCDSPFRSPKGSVGAIAGLGIIFFLFRIWVFVFFKLLIQVDLDIKESKSETEEKSDEEEEEEETSEKVDNIKLFVFHSGRVSASRMWVC
jgi:hypothetical protein